MVKAVYIGSDEFSAEILRELLRMDKINIVAIATYPDIPHGRGHKLLPTPVKQAAQEAGLPIVEVADVSNPEIHRSLSSLGAAMAILVSFKIVPNEFLNAFSKGVVNLHPSLLPDLRGAAPIQWAIMRGYAKSGITTFLVSEKLDAGNILMQKEFPISDNETAGEFFAKIIVPGAILLAETIDVYASGELKPIEQAGGQINRAPRILHKHRIIDWQWNSAKIHNRIRGLSPDPGALTTIKGKNFRILRSQIILCENIGLPGELANINSKEIIVSTANGAISILEIQPEGRQKMTAQEFIRGYIRNQKIFFGS